MGKLKAGIALLPDRDLSNRVSAAALLVHGATGGRLRWPRMSSHLSLGQPFSIDSLAPVERCFDQVAREVGPVEVTLGAVEIEPPSQNGPEAVVWISVRPSPALIELQERLGCELAKLAPDSSAALGGQAFHLTIGFLPAANLASPDHLPSFEGSVSTLHELGLFLYDGLPRAGWQCMLYARRRLGLIPPGPSV